MYSLRQHVQTGSRAHTQPQRVLTSGVKRPRRGAMCSLPSISSWRGA